MPTRKASLKSSKSPAENLIPPRPTLSLLKEAAADCKACDLWKRGTQTVFGEGRRPSKVMFVGEQPGNEEDLAGKPFVGPAGRLFDAALDEAGIDRRQAYVTNVVKHFKWEPRGKRRIHQRPNTEEIRACRLWFEAEVQRVKPRVVLCLGATAAQALISPTFRVTRQHGILFPSAFGPMIAATVHPASILRAPDPEAREVAYAGFVDDLRQI